MSSIEVTPARGLFTGNRGCLHGNARNLLTSGWRTKGWIVCSLEYKNLRRTPMTPGRWTELFFLDEAVALSAGHRPCALCRRESFRAFASASGFATAAELDRALHPERIARIKRGQRTHGELRSLPDGVFVVYEGAPFLKYEGHLLEWTHAGYTRTVECASDTVIEIITPATTVRALRNGYVPVLHASAANPRANSPQPVLPS